MRYALFALFFITACASSPSKSPKVIEHELDVLSQTGDRAENIKKYFEENASVFPSGYGGEKFSTPVLFVGSKDKPMDFEGFMSALTNAASERKYSESAKAAKNPNASEGTDSAEENPQCSFTHTLGDNTFGSVTGWAKEKFNLDRESALKAFSIFKAYSDYEYRRQRGTVVLKEAIKPDLVIVSIASNGKNKFAFAKGSLEKTAIDALSEVYFFGGSAGRPVYFAGYKKVPCGIVAMKFKKIVFEDYGMVVHGASFTPSKP